jgi:uncharacterized Zn finger protein
MEPIEISVRESIPEEQQPVQRDFCLRVGQELQVGDHSFNAHRLRGEPACKFIWNVSLVENRE